MKIYLASGWFTTEQKQKMDKVRNFLLKQEYQVFTPFYDGIVLEKDASQEERKKVFDIDIGMIRHVDLVVAIIDDFEPGTIFEMGYAKGYEDAWDLIATIRPPIRAKILAYSDVSGRGLNVMLAEACIGFANGLRELGEKLKKINVLIENPEHWRNEIE